MRRKQVVCLVVALYMVCSPTGVMAGDEFALNAFFLVPYYASYAQYVELGEYKIFYEEDFGEQEEGMFYSENKYLEKVVERSHITGYPQRLTDSVDVMAEFFSSALEITKKYLPEEEWYGSDLYGIDAEKMEEFFEEQKNQIVVAYAIALNEGIDIQPFDSDIFESYNDMEEEMIGLLKAYEYEELTEAFLECIKYTYLIEEVEAYLEENAEIVTNIETKNDGYAYEEGDYIFPDSNSRYLTEEDVENLSLEEINRAKNEIFARLGRKFESQELQEYFNSKNWYNGVYEAEDFDRNYMDLLNEYEWANSEFLSEIEYTLSGW